MPFPVGMPFPCFNPTMVRLLPNASTSCSLLRSVSIPQWCDCCANEILVDNRTFSFNPTMVRLLPEMPTMSATTAQSFNPTMVRLLRKMSTSCGSLHSCFNPTMVRLLPCCPHYPQKTVSRFNPTMVRLLPYLHVHHPTKTNAFQSHNGAIAAR